MGKVVKAWGSGALYPDIAPALSKINNAAIKVCANWATQGIWSLLSGNSVTRVLLGASGSAASASAVQQQAPTRLDLTRKRF